LLPEDIFDAVANERERERFSPVAGDRR